MDETLHPISIFEITTEADTKEVQIVYGLFLVNCYILHVPRLPSQPASNVGGWVIDWTGLTGYSDD